jgi:hypothetical protein
MPGAGKENQLPAAAAADAADKKAPEKRKADEAEDDSIGPGDEKEGVAAIGWIMPCKCSVLAGKYGAGFLHSRVVR